VIDRSIDRLIDWFFEERVCFIGSLQLYITYSTLRCSFTWINRCLNEKNTQKLWTCCESSPYTTWGADQQISCVCLDPWSAPSFTTVALYSPGTHRVRLHLVGQENPAVARKPRDATAVLFSLKFADDIHYKFKSNQASKARLQSSKHTGTKQNLTQNGDSRSFK